MKQILCLLAALALLAIGNLAHSATITWTNTSGGNWGVTNNWNPNQVPGPGDNANINSAGTYTVTDDVTVAISFRVGGDPSGVQNLRVANGVTLTCAAGSAPPGSGRGSQWHSDSGQWRHICSFRFKRLPRAAR